MVATIDDSMQARISTDCPDETKTVLYHAWAHDTTDLKKLLDVPGKASAQDPTTGETPLHAAIRACGPAPPPVGEEDGEEADGTVIQEAKDTVQELFVSGAIWNDVDSKNETPGCVALRLGQKELYELCVQAGVRAELLFGLLDGYEELSSGPEEDAQEVVEVEANGENSESIAKALEEAGDAAAAATATGNEGEEEAKQEAEQPQPEAKRQKTTEPEGAPDVNSEQYLASELKYDADKLVDDEGNGVMMAWETSIMRRSVDALLRPSPSAGSSSEKQDDQDQATAAPAQGKRILNVGFGMGIIDTMFAATKPQRHHIIEAHPAVLAHIDNGGTAFGAEWEASGPEDGAYKVHRGRWQDVVPQLLEAGELYDAIYFDTFGEDYAQLKMFFEENIPGMMDQEGRFGFFNGLGADRRVCYDVYTRVVDMHMADAGMEVEWEEVDVDMKGMEEAGKGEWKDVRRRYWTLDKYRLPMCTFMG